LFIFCCLFPKLEPRPIKTIGIAVSPLDPSRLYTQKITKEFFEGAPGLIRLQVF
jgi:hypothetical protein